MIMKLYSAKFEEYLTMSREDTTPRSDRISHVPRTEEIQPEISLRNRASNPVSEPLEVRLRKLKFVELEREINNLRAILAIAVIPKLTDIEIVNVTLLLPSFLPHP